MARNRTEFTIDGDIYIFDRNAFAEIYKNYKGSKTDAIEYISKETGCESDTVRGWARGAYGPSELKSVEVLADFFGCDIKVLLIVVKRKGSEMEKREISKSERKAARKLYKKMCDLLQKITYEAPDFELNEYYHDNTKKKKKADPPRSVESLRKEYKFVIRKTALDLNAQLRADLYDWVLECFGGTPASGEDEEGWLILLGSNYQNYLDENGWRDTDESRYKYVSVFEPIMSEKLDEIFKDYICI